MASFTLCLVVALLLPATVMSFCYRAEPKFLTGPNDELLPYCEYHGIRLAPGSKFEDLSRCFSVNCDENGMLGACGYTRSSTSFIPQRIAMASSTLCLVVALLLPATVMSFCYRAEPKFLTGPHDLQLPYCEYNGLNLAPGSSFEDLDRCLSVSCNDEGTLGVCGTGTNAGVISLPDGCLSVNELCVAKIIQDPKISIPCGLIS